VIKVYYQLGEGSRLVVWFLSNPSPWCWSQTDCAPVEDSDSFWLFQKNLYMMTRWAVRDFKFRWRKDDPNDYFKRVIPLKWMKYSCSKLAISLYVLAQAGPANVILTLCNCLHQWALAIQSPLQGHVETENWEAKPTKQTGLYEYYHCQRYLWNR